MTPIERARKLFVECLRYCTCGGPGSGGGGAHDPGCGDPTPEDVADAITDAIRAERETCIDLAKWIVANVPGESSRSEGAVDTAIRLLAAWQPKEEVHEA